MSISQSGAMMLTTLILFSSLVTVSVQVDFMEALKAYEPLTNERHFSPQSKFEVSPEEILAYTRSGSIFASKGVAVSNHVVNLSVAYELYQNISAQLDELVKLDPTNPHIKEAVRSKEKTNNLLSSICNYEGKVEKRFIVTTLLVSFFSSLVFSGLTTVGVYAALGQFDSKALVQEEIGLGGAKNEKQKQLDQFFFKRIKEIRKQTQSLAHRLEINDAATIINLDFETLMTYLESIVNVDSYDFTPSRFLENIESNLSNNSQFTSLMEGSMFGLKGTTTLLSISESESLLMSQDDKYLCQDSSIITKIKTTIPDEMHQAKATEDKFRYKLDEKRSLYVNPKMILERSKFRPIAQFSKQRTIIGLDQKIKSILPFNNTLLHIKTEGGFKIEKTCNNQTKEIRVFKNPWIKIPYHCTIQSPFINVSRFHLMYSLNEVDVQDEIHEIVHVDFSPLYDHNEDLDIEDYEMESKINEIFEIGKRITTIDKELLADRTDRQIIQDGVVNFFSGIKDFFKSFIDSVIINPFHQMVTILVVLLLVVAFALWLWRRRNKRRNKHQKKNVETTDPIVPETTDPTVPE